MGKRMYHREPAESPPEFDRPGAVRRQFAKTLSKLLTDAGMIQIELSRATGIPRETISKYSSGRILPGPKNLAAIAGVLKVNVEDLLPMGDVMTSDDVEPAFEAKAIGGDPSSVWLRISAKVPTANIGRILELIQDKKPDER